MCPRGRPCIIVLSSVEFHLRSLITYHSSRRTKMDATTSAVVMNATNATNDDDPQWIGAIESAAVILVGIIALFFGSLVCATIYLRPRLRTVTNLLIVNLAIADICVAVVSVPFVAASLAVRRWIFGDAWCRAAGFLSVLFSGASIVTLAAISVERLVTDRRKRKPGKRRGGSSPRATEFTHLCRLGLHSTCTTRFPGNTLSS